MEKGGRA